MSTGVTLNSDLHIPINISDIAAIGKENTKIDIKSC